MNVNHISDANVASRAAGVDPRIPHPRLSRGAFTRVELPAVSARKSKGFTLVELLVVVAIIALLLGILLPALGKARTIVNIRVCEANVASVMKAMAFYLNEHAHVYPIADAPTLGTVNLLGSLGEKTSAAAARIEPQDRLLNPYLTTGTLDEFSRIKIAECPLDKGDSEENQLVDRTVYQIHGSSYAYLNRSVAQAATGTKRVRAGIWAPSGHRENEFRLMAQKVIVSDFNMLADRSADNAKNQWKNNSVPLSATVGFADTHVEQVNRKEGTGNGQPAWPAGMADLTDALLDDLMSTEYH